MQRTKRISLLLVHPLGSEVQLILKFYCISSEFSFRCLKNNFPPYKYPGNVIFNGINKRKYLKTFFHLFSICFLNIATNMSRNESPVY